MQVTGRVVFEAEASWGGGEVRQVVSPLSPFPPLPLSIPPKFLDKPVGGKVRSSEGEVPRLPPPYKYQPGCENVRAFHGFPDERESINTFHWNVHGSAGNAKQWGMFLSKKFPIKLFAVTFTFCCSTRPTTSWATCAAGERGFSVPAAGCARSLARQPTHTYNKYYLLTYKLVVWIDAKQFTASRSNLQYVISWR